jgi:hypothetical protein
MSPKRGYGKSYITTLITQRAVLIGTIVSIAIIVVIAPMPALFGSKAAQISILGVVSSLLGACMVGLLWEMTSKRAFLEEVADELGAKVAVIATSNNLATSLEREGIVLVTRDFHSGIPWRDYIDKADSIDLLWWAGRSWLRQHASALDERRSSRSLSVRMLLPDTSTKVIVSQMSRDSTYDIAALRNATAEAVSLARTVFGDNLRIYLLPYAPRCMYIRLGDYVIYSTYPNVPGLNIARPTLVCMKDKGVGNAVGIEFEQALQIGMLYPAGGA